MGRTRDRRKSLWGVFPSSDPNYKKWNQKYPGSRGDTQMSEPLKRIIKKTFTNVLLLDQIFTDVTKRDKVRLSYKILTLFGKRDLKVKVRMPDKPNIYYLDNDWYKTGDYYVDPVEIWWSEHGKVILKEWKETCDIQKSSTTNDDILKSIRDQYTDPDDTEPVPDPFARVDLNTGKTFQQLWDEMDINPKSKDNDNDDNTK